MKRDREQASELYARAQRTSSLAEAQALMQRAERLSRSGATRGNPTQPMLRN